MITLYHQPSFRRSYDTALKHIFRIGCSDILPPQLAHAIPKSCVSRWKKENPERYTGFELNNIAAQQLEILQQFAAHKNAQRIFIAYVRLFTAIRTILSSENKWINTLAAAKSQVVNAVLRTKSAVPLKRILHLLNISPNTFYLWQFKVKYACGYSELKLCRKRFTHQLLPIEINQMKKLLTDHQFKHWPIVSIAHYAARNKLLFAAINTWYHYAKILGLHKKTMPKPNKKTIGIRANAPNQFWHADVTLFRSTDGMRFYIYLVVDNFSRKILAWQCSTKLSAAIRLKTIHDAWLSNSQSQADNQHVNLIVDGGSENNNHLIENFIAQGSVSIHKKIALKDIFFSNSMVQAVNKVLKYRYLFHAPIHSEQMENVLKQAIHDYNHLRPHGSLKGLTPHEAYLNIPLPVSNHDFILARMQRIAQNRAFNCDFNG